jgi:CTD small phosphatase-like protein 2
VFYLVRPGVSRFLSELSQFYEIVVFTAALQDYADWILDQIDHHSCISHRLYRQHTKRKTEYALKDLSLLGRDLKKTIIVDNIAENFKYLQPFNGIHIKSWYDDMEDTELDLLLPFLKRIAERGVPDVREPIRIY